MVVNGAKYLMFDIIVESLSWKIQRILWIGFFKNVNNDKCMIPKLPKDVLQKILGVLQFSLI